MQIKLFVVLIVLCAGAACAPEKKCSGELVYDDPMELCVPCPKGATFKDGSCNCPAGYDYVDFQCKLNADAMVGDDADAMVMGTEDAGAKPDAGGGYEGASCQDYCSFMNTCIGMNSLASALGTVAADLHADDPAACKSSCQSDLGNGESSNAALACISAQKSNPMCGDANPQTGLMAAFGVIGECCGTRTSDPLCKSICKPLKASPIFSSMVPFCP
jgi:hypothetical protein